MRKALAEYVFEDPTKERERIDLLVRKGIITPFVVDGDIKTYIDPKTDSQEETHKQLDAYGKLIAVRDMNIELKKRDQVAIYNDGMARLEEIYPDIKRLSQEQDEEIARRHAKLPGHSRQ